MIHFNGINFKGETLAPKQDDKQPENIVLQAKSPEAEESKKNPHPEWANKMDLVKKIVKSKKEDKTEAPKEDAPKTEPQAEAKSTEQVAPKTEAQPTQDAKAEA